jgi:glucosylceramidase
MASAFLFKFGHLWMPVQKVRLNPYFLLYYNKSTNSGGINIPKRGGIVSLFKGCFFSSLFVVLTAVPLLAQNASLRTTTDANRWVDGGSISAANWSNTNSYVEIFPSTQYQTVLGWGGTIQERHWVAMSVLSAAGKDSIMRALFDTSGCNITYLRVSIGCSDFDLNEAPISLNETKDDYEMTNFSLHRDSTRKIPMIKMAQAINPNIHFWGCPWSPPRWMHTNGDFMTGNMKSDAKTYAAYALYLEKFVTGYKAAGIPMDWVCCQNEPTIVDGGYPKCGWTTAQEVDFYKNYLIPRFKQNNISTRIILGVFCCGAYADWIPPFMNDATIKEFVAATSHSYQNPDWGLKSNTDYPTIPFVQSEAPFGPWPDVGPQNWARGQDLFNNVADFMNNRTAVYTLWNMVNDETAKSGFNWAQTIAIQVNSTTKQVTYNPWFYAYKHFCNFVKPGAKAIRCTANGGGPSKMSAFKNPDGSVILVMNNSNSSSMSLTVKVDNQMWKATLPGTSFSTIKIPFPTTVREAKPQVAAMPVLNNARIANSTLYFTHPAAQGAVEMSVTLMDLEGRTVWTASRGVNEIQGTQQVFAVKSAKGSLSNGMYLLTVKIKNPAGEISSIQGNVSAVD